MVQKKAPDKHGSPAEPRRSHAKPEKRLYSQQHQEGRGVGGGCDLKKMLKKSRSIKVLEESLDSPLGTQLVQLGNPPAQRKKKRPTSAGLPNYMKSTSSSNAKKEQAQVSTRVSDHLKKKPPSPTGGASGPKPAKLLARKPSLRLVRPPMKRILGINPSWPTCSSTMKEATFPDHLDLSPGATEAEGTSILKVCPYTYCSLNGHRHAPLPPLRCFLSARRQLLKTQKSMKLRGLPSFRRTGPEAAAAAEMGAGEGASAIVEDLGDDFFVEIYASAPVGGVGDGADPAPAADGMAVAGDGGEGCEDEIEEDAGSCSIDEFSRSQVSLDESLDQMSEFSPSEMEVLVNFLEFVECDPEDPPCTAQDQGDYWNWGCCVPADDCGGFDGELAAEEGSCGPVSGAADLDGEEDDALYIDFDEIDYSEFAGDESTDGISILFDADGVASKEDHFGIRGCEEEDTEDIVAENEGGTALEEAIEAVTSKSIKEEYVMEEEEEEEVVVEDMSCEEEEEEETEGVGQETEDLIGNTANDQVEDVEMGNETAADETQDASAMDENPHADDKEEEKDQNEVSNTEMETCESEEGDESLSRVLEEMPTESDDMLGASSELSTAASTECPQDDATSLGEEEHTDASIDSRARAIARRKKGNGDEEDELRPFNPREPNFLPLDPDPEKEKVDLRHQLTDERKNSEEWMVDYAIRRAVDKLATGRKRKVALLVEAFETVAPVPPYGSSVGHSAVGFPHARPIQACS